MTIDPLRTGALILEQAEEGSQWIREVGHISRRKSESGRGTLVGIAELILPVSHPERAPHPAQPQEIVQADRIDSIVDEVVRAVERDDGEGDPDARVIQKNAPDLPTHFEGVPSPDDAQIVAPRKRRAD